MKKIFLLAAMMGMCAFICFDKNAILPVFAGEEWIDLFGVYRGMGQEEFVQYYPKENARTYRKADRKEWITFDYADDFALGLDFLEKLSLSPYSMITFFFVDELLVSWSLNDREEITKEYLSEYCSQTFIQHIPKMYDAIKNCLNKLPDEVFYSVTDRACPILFTEYHYKGISRFASSSAIISSSDDVPSFENGFTIIKLSTELGDIGSVAAIEGVVFHEIAHHYLEHSSDSYDREFERQANNLIKEWGYEEEFQAASDTFGSEDRKK